MQRFLIALLFSACLFAAIPTTTVWEVRPTVGSDTNGAGFDAAGSGTDMSQFNNKNAAACTSCQSSSSNISTTDALAAGTTTITSATAAFTSAITGNIVFFSGGTGSIAAQWRRATFVSATNITIDASIAASTGMTMNIGGALNSLGQLNTNMALVAGQTAWVKATGTITTGSIITFAGGSASTAQLPIVTGYTTTRGDGGSFTIQATASLNPVFQMITGNNGLTFKNVIVDCNSQTSTGGIQMNSAFQTLENAQVKNCTANFGIQLNNVDIICRRCYVTTQSGASPFVFSSSRSELCFACVAYANTTNNPAFNMLNGEGTCDTCIAANNSGGTSAHGFQLNTGNGQLVVRNSVSYKNAGDGMRITFGAGSYQTINSAFYGNTGFAINCPTTCNSGAGTLQGGNLNFNAYESGKLNNVPAGANDQTLSADPFVNGASNNFAPNNTAGGGALLRGNGFPGVLFVGGTGFASIGALASSSAGGAVGFPIIQDQF